MSMSKTRLLCELLTHWSLAAKSLQSCLTLCDHIDGSPPGSPIPGTLQARTLEWVAISFSNAWKWKVKVTSLSRVWPSVTPWTAAFQAPPSMGFSRQECWSGVPLPSPSQPDEKFPRYVSLLVCILLICITYVRLVNTHTYFYTYTCLCWLVKRFEVIE